MGMRSQIYIRYNVDGKKGLIAKDYECLNYGKDMISRARSIIETLNHGWTFNVVTREMLIRFCDVNFDTRGLMIGLDLIDEAETDFNRDYMYIFTVHNEKGQLLIDVIDNGIKYCFIPRYNNIAVMDGRQYLIWDTKDAHPHYRWTEEDPPKKMDEGTILYTLNNVAYIDRNATLMTKEEVEEFVNADYSYLFTKASK